MRELPAIDDAAIRRLVMSRPIPMELADAIIEAPLLSPEEIAALGPSLERGSRGGTIGGPQATEILALVCQGYTNEQIGSALGKSKFTIHTYVKQLVSAFGARNRTHLAAIVVAHGRADA